MGVGCTLPFDFRIIIKILFLQLQSSDSLVLGSLQKGSVDVTGAFVEICQGNMPDLPWVLRLQNPNMCTVFEMATTSQEEAVEWFHAIKETAQTATVRVSILTL